jgi:hypothetical protein
MRGLSAADMVRVWERGTGRHPIDRALAILAVADAGAGCTSPGDLPLGERNRRLLAIRERTFGDALDALTTCVQCGERVEVRVSAHDVAAGSSDALPAAADSPTGIRRLTSRDLAAAARCGDPASARLALAARALHPDAAEEADLSALSEADVDRIARRLHEMDPLAVLLLDVRCPACGAEWECELDVAEFVWTEIEAEALRLLRDVHTLAAAYGWREADILSMSPLRRRAYLELVQ